MSRRSSLLTRHTVSAIALAIALGGCGTTAKRDTPSVAREPASRAPAAPAPGRGGYYLDDGPGPNPPADLDSVADAIPRWEPLHRGASRPYVVMGKSYTPMASVGHYKARGIASWYGRRYHGKRTSSGETYDMYAMTAAHPTLPIPSYVRVTHIATARSVVLRVNDRGPFLGDRLIDLSYTAAYKLGMLNGGSALVEVESVVPGAPAPSTVVVRPPLAPAVAVATVATPEASIIDVQPLPGTEAVRDTAGASIVPPPSSGLFLQLGAFGSRENAESYLARVKAQVDWLAERVQVLMRDGYYRVHAGPYASQAEARDDAQRVSAVLGMKPVLVNR